MKHERFLAWCLSTPWAMQPERMSAYATVLAAVLAGGGRIEGKKKKDKGAAAGPPAGRPNYGGVGIIPVYGTIVPRAAMLDLCEEGTSTAQIRALLADANADPQVAQILLDIDSPGGSVADVPEVSADIAASKKPVVAFARSLAASAGYWIGSQATEFYMSPSAEVGSIGVWSAHYDWSKALEQDGIKPTLISAGKFKVEGNPFEPLSDEARAFMQSRIDDYYQMFTKAVAKGRKVGIDAVRGGMGQGRCYGATQAQAENMVDGVMTFGQVVAQMQKNIKKGAGASRLSAAQREIAILD
jgi:signal peptide peptidase SppA